MKVFSLVASLILTTLILIIAFGNISAQCTYITFLFWTVPTGTSPTMLVFFTTFLGILAGLSYGTFFRLMFAEGDEEESDF